jgi:lysyl-tRNA synthetase class I
MDPADKNAPKILKRQTMTETDVAWFAGFYEGEGTAYCCRQYKKTKHEMVPRIAFSLRLNIVQVDREPLDKIVAIFNGGNLNGPYLGKANRKPHYQLNYTNKKAIEIMELARPYLSKRRVDQYEDALRKYNQCIAERDRQPPVPRGPRGPYGKRPPSVRA